MGLWVTEDVRRVPNDSLGSLASERQVLARAKVGAVPESHAHRLGVHPFARRQCLFAAEERRGVAKQPLAQIVAIRNGTRRGGDRRIALGRRSGERDHKIHTVFAAEHGRLDVRGRRCHASCRRAAEGTIRAVFGRIARLVVGAGERVPVVAVVVQLC